jgi:hypothetical protein
MISQAIDRSYYNRHINPHLYQFKYKYEDATVARQMFYKGDFLFSYNVLIRLDAFPFVNMISQSIDRSYYDRF